ncbi:MAG: peroxidase [Candidatus Eisenbacteria bacterium]
MTADSLDETFGTAEDRALLQYAEKLTRDPGSITEADARRLRQAGFDDRAIHDACAIAAYYAYVNRIASGLGVELEDRFGEDPAR